MDASWIDPVVWIVLGVVSLGALATGVGLVIKAFSFQHYYLVSSLIGIVAVAIFTAAGLLGPLAIFSGKEYQQAHLLADLMMIGISGLVVLGIILFIIDHLQERPGFLMLAAATSLAAGFFPWIYIMNAARFNELFGISIVSPEAAYSTGLNPLEGDKGSLDEVSSSSNPAQDELPELIRDPASRFTPLTPPPRPIEVKPSADVTQNSGDVDEEKGSSKDWLYDDP